MEEINLISIELVVEIDEDKKDKIEEDNDIEL